MLYSKLKVVALWAVCLGLLCTLIGGAVIASGLAPSDDKPAPITAERLLATAPVPKAPPVEIKVGLRQSSLRNPWNIESVAFSPDGKTIASGHWVG